MGAVTITIVIDTGNGGQPVLNVSTAPSVPGSLPIPPSFAPPSGFPPGFPPPPGFPSPVVSDPAKTEQPSEKEEK